MGVDRPTSRVIFEKITHEPTAVSFKHQNMHNKKENDQRFLAKHVYELIRGMSLVHDSYL
jgi:hypothetical protein